MKRFASLSVTLLWSLVTLSSAQTPTVINYQGRLVDGTNLVNATVGVSLRIYTNNAGGAMIYEDSNSVTVVDGLYSTLIGDGTTFGNLTTALAAPEAKYIEVAINGTALSPREPLAAVAYARTAVLRTGDTMTGPLGIDAGPGGNLIITSSGTDISIGSSANGENSGIAVGSSTEGVDLGVGIGYEANGSHYAVALGYGADGADHGVSIGSDSYAYEEGVAVGYYAGASETGTAVGSYADGAKHGVAVGHSAQGQGSGIAVGNNATGDDVGIAIGRSACGAHTNIAIGYMAAAGIGPERIAIGRSVATPQNNAAAIRGTLFLDGATGIYYRSTFGSGDWAPFSPASATGYVQRTGDTMTGPLVIRAGGMNDIIIGGAGAGIRIGNNANADTESMAIGNGSTGASYSVVVGRYARADAFGAALGAGADANNNGTAVGFEANGADNGAAFGYQAIAPTHGVAVGPVADGRYHGVAVGDAAGATNYGTAVGAMAGGRNYGAAAGAGAGGYDYGAAVGNNAQGMGYGVAVGAASSGSATGVAVGAGAQAYNGGIAIGSKANGTWGRIAIGPDAAALDNFNVVAIGAQITNRIQNSIALRGTLYLDGATGILYRTTFGSGAWSNMLGNVFESDPVWAAASNGMQTQINAKLSSNTWAAAGSTTNYVSRTGDTMTGTLTMNVGAEREIVIGGGGTNVAIGNGANARIEGVAVGFTANGADSGVAVGHGANGNTLGTAVGRSADGTGQGVGVGYSANGATYGAAVGSSANAPDYGAALGYFANAPDYGAAVGYNSKGWSRGVAVGTSANGAKTNIAIGAHANAQYGGLATNRIAIGYNVTNRINNSARIRGSLYLDGGSGVYTNTAFGSQTWGLKAFTIDHPLDPQNKVLRHFCVEGPDVWNIYAGNAVLSGGRAVVDLPVYYSALNRPGSEIYDLTAVGGQASLWIEKEAIGNSFVIAGDRDVKVSWTVKALRNDPAAVADLKQRPVEQLKSELEPGRTQASR